MAELLAAVGQSEPGLHQPARVGFATLGLQTYLTAGPKEARARGWVRIEGRGHVMQDGDVMGSASPCAPARGPVRRDRRATAARRPWGACGS